MSEEIGESLLVERRVIVHISSLSNEIGKVSEVLAGCTTSDHFFGLFSTAHLERICGLVVKFKLVKSMGSIGLLEQIAPGYFGVGSHFRDERASSHIVRLPASLSSKVRYRSRCAIDGREL